MSVNRALETVVGGMMLSGGVALAVTTGPEAAEKFVESIRYAHTAMDPLRIAARALPFVGYGILIESGIRNIADAIAGRELSSRYWPSIRLTIGITRR